MRPGDEQSCVAANLSRLEENSFLATAGASCNGRDSGVYRYVPKSFLGFLIHNDVTLQLECILKQS